MLIRYFIVCFIVSYMLSFKSVFQSPMQFYLLDSKVHSLLKKYNILIIEVIILTREARLMEMVLSRVFSATNFFVHSFT